MRGSQWEREVKGPGIRLEWVLVAVAVLVSLSVLAVYYYGGGARPPQTGEDASITTVTTTGVECGAPSLPAEAAAVEQDPRFGALAGGECYNFMGAAPAGGGDLLTFDYFNGTVAYPCGTTAEDLVGGEIQALVSTTNGTVSSVDAVAPPAAPPCPSSPPVDVLSVVDVGSLIPAVPQLNVTLAAAPGAPLITSLKASLAFEDGSQYFDLVAHPSTLSAGGEVSKTEIVSTNFAFTQAVLYPMTVWGTFADGQAFSYVAYVEVVGGF